VWSPGALIGLLVLLRVVAPLPPAAEPWRARVDVPLALLVGVAFGVLAAFWLAPHHLIGYPLLASDYSQYCEKVAALRDGASAHPHPSRSWWAGLLPGLLARRWGVEGGLALGALISVGCLGSGLFLCARLVHSRAAGVLAALLALGSAPVILLSRTASFYPEIVAVSMLAIALGAGAAVLGGWGWWLAGGIGAGAALLVDVRGFQFGLTALALALLGTLRAPDRILPVRVGCVLLPVMVSWWLAHDLALQGDPGLYVQSHAYLEWGMLEAGLGRLETDPSRHDWLWGRSTLLDVPEALAALVSLAGRAPPELAAYQATRIEWTSLVLPVAGCVAVGLAGAVVLLRRAPWRLFVALAAVAPFLAVSVSAVRTLPSARYLGTGFSGLWVLVGLGVAGLLTGERGLLPARARVPVVLAVMVLVAAGSLPTWYSPLAPWRRPVGSDHYPAAIAEGRGEPHDARCAAAYAADAAGGRRFMPYTASRRRPPPLLPGESGDRHLPPPPPPSPD